jgi:hypothetical protein
METLPAEFRPGGWVNGDRYMRSNERFGILPIPEGIRARIGLLEFHSDFAVKKKIKHIYLARLQHTRIAVLPVHTKAERWLFSFLVSETHGLFAGPREPNWEAVAIRWAGHSDGVTIFYKVSMMQAQNVIT